MDRTELIKLCAQAKHRLEIKDGKYILHNNSIPNKLTYTSEQQVIDFCNKTIQSWGR